MAGIKDLSGLLTGSFCPKIKINIPSGIQSRHDKIKMKSMERLEKHLLSMGLKLLSTAGIHTPEANVEIWIANGRYQGRPDILALISMDDGYMLAVVEVKSSEGILENISTLVQASAYAIPIYSCMKTPSDCKIEVANKNKLLLETRHGSLYAAMNNNLEEYHISKEEISDFKVYLAGPSSLKDITSQSIPIIEMLIHSHQRIHDPETIVPGPWCRFCELFANEKCTAGLS